MASLRSAGLRRRLEALTGAVAAAVRRREALRDKAKALPIVAAGLARARLDPGEISQFWTLERAADELSRLGDSTELQQRDAAFAAQQPGHASGASLGREAARRAPAFAGRPPPRGGSLLDWYAWSLATEPSRGDD
jgi:hypothetical protein